MEEGDEAPAVSPKSTMAREEDVASCRWRTNAQLVERAVRVAAEVGRKPAAPAETRALLRLT